MFFLWFSLGLAHVKEIVVKFHPPNLENRAKLQIIPPNAQHKSAPLAVCIFCFLYFVYFGFTFCGILYYYFGFIV